MSKPTVYANIEQPPKKRTKISSRRRVLNNLFVIIPAEEYVLSNFTGAEHNVYKVANTAGLEGSPSGQYYAVGFFSITGNNLRLHRTSGADYSIMPL